MVFIENDDTILETRSSSTVVWRTECNARFLFSPPNSSNLKTDQRCIQSSCWPRTSTCLQRKRRSQTDHKMETRGILFSNDFIFTIMFHLWSMNISISINIRKYICRRRGCRMDTTLLKQNKSFTKM